MENIEGSMEKDLTDRDLKVGSVFANNICVFIVLHLIGDSRMICLTFPTKSTLPEFPFAPPAGWGVFWKGYINGIIWKKI